MVESQDIKIWSSHSIADIIAPEGQGHVVCDQRAGHLFAPKPFFAPY